MALVQSSCELMNLNPEMTCVIVTFLVIPILTLHMNTLYAIPGSSTSIHLVQLNANGNGATSGSSDAPSVLRLSQSNNTNTNTDTNDNTNNPPSKESEPSDLIDGGVLHTSTDDTSSNNKHDRNHNDVTVHDDSNKNDNLQGHNKHKEHGIEGNNRYKLKVGDIPFP
jgi:hypothetical protein